MSDLKDVALREEVRAFLEKFPKRGGPVMARAIFDAKDGKNKMLNLIRAQRNAGAENISAQNYYETQMEVGDGQSIKIRVYNAEPERPKTALIYLHGGGWTIGSAQTCAKVSSDFAKYFTVIVPEYRLAPEHPYPAALDDVLATVKWALGNSEQLGILNGDFFMCGDSAGGHLAITSALKSISQKLPTPAKLALFYPVTSMFYKGDSWDRFASGYALDAEAMDAFNCAYCGDISARRQPCVSPLEFADFKGFPPTITIFSSHDILRDQCKQFAKKLSKTGVPSHCACIEGAPHIFMTMPGMEECYNEAFKLARDFLISDMPREKSRQ